VHKSQEEKIEELRKAGIRVQLVPMAVIPYRIYGLEENEVINGELMNIDEAHRKVCGSVIEKI
jgi:hypothetical protein